MENNCEVNVVSPKMMDRDAETLSESQSNSLESGLTVESSRDDADSNLEECGSWTNEKHNSYLDSLENSFVRQLYSLLGREEEETRRLSKARHVHSNSHKSTHQFTVLQNGSRQKSNFGKKRAFLTTDQGNVLRKESDRALTRLSLGREYPAQSTAEASGQNFREEVGEKGCNSGMSRKRRREANYDESSLNDQDGEAPECETMQRNRKSSVE
ncbi:unnamed protein product [Eruca vesicaria subsp. sativa]|uniref:Uncharacterized protein n=1 Tax=Eruca vesicaria subsp. sativa TaxID=29727 RepID=A0ABC8JK63_ERUVS|nr:unnamed protein product [Eruca vesicaria subsp. sativa]